eukprot:g12132.t1
MSKQTGTVAKWLNHKGIGFITPDVDEDNSGDILVHYQQIQQTTQDGFKSLAEGSKVEYETMDDPKNPGEKKVAINVTGEGGMDCTPKQKGGNRGPKGGKKGKRGGKKGGKGKGDDGGGGSQEGSPSGGGGEQ